MSRERLIDMVEVPIMATFGNHAARRSSSTTVHAVVDRRPRWTIVVAILAFPIGLLALFRRVETSHAHFSASEDLDGLTLRCEGGNVAFQYEAAAAVADMLLDLRLLDEHEHRRVREQLAS